MNVRSIIGVCIAWLCLAATNPHIVNAQVTEPCCAVQSAQPATCAAEAICPHRAGTASPTYDRSYLLPVPARKDFVRVSPGPEPARAMCRMGFEDWVVNPLKATAILVLPVAGVSALLSEQSGRAAAGALAAGVGYVAAGTVAIAVKPQCSSTDALVYIWTPLAAIAGAVLATR